MSQYDEGHTVAGWTGFGIATVGVMGIGFGICAGNALGVWGGLAVVVISLLVTWVLHLAGWGKPPGRRPVGDWAMRAKDRTAREGHPGCLGCRLAGRGRPAELPARVTAETGRGEPVTEPAG
ncbi:HGxxPAAW family protein [Streptomyces sp. NPDC058249]|uniref:HGxxPAAW family protein n=1 Tax=Streptomyces sp. NPDC058249 TaxID=3346403 RepID=UPI0036ED31F8